MVYSTAEDQLVHAAQRLLQVMLGVGLVQVEDVDLLHAEGVHRVLQLPPDARRGQAPVWPLEIGSATIKRVCRSTLSAEANGILEGAEGALFVREFLTETKSPFTTFKELLDDAAKIPVTVVTDARSLQSHLATDCRQVSDKRLRVLIAQLRQIQDEGAAFLWADTRVMLADGLTKMEGERAFLTDTLGKGIWCIADTPGSLDAKARSRAQRHARKLALRSSRVSPSQKSKSTTTPC